jgi:beta-galactosidase
MWTGVDYIGESSGWPSKGWPSAPFDMCMSEKPRGGYFRALWNEKPFLGLYVIDYNLDEDPGKDHWQAPGMVHDWTFPYQDARVMQIQTPSNCDEVMLIDPRGKVYGPRKPRDYINNTIKWNQPYRPGKVVVIGYKDGIEVCRDSIQTSGNKAVRFTLKADREQLKADGQDLSHISLNLYDEQGIPIRIDDRQVKVTVEGNGRLMGIDSGEMRRSERFSSHTLPTYLGRAQIVVQAGRMRGQLKVKVEVEGMASQELVLLVG